MIDPIVAALRGHRERLGWSPERLANRAAISVHTVRDVESGRSRSPRVDTLRAIAAAMDLNITLFPHLAEVGAAKPGGEDTPQAIERRRKDLAEALRGAPGRRVA